MKYIIIITLAVLTIACSNQEQENQKLRSITELGIYKYEERKLTIIAYRENFLLRYMMLDSTNNILLKNTANISLMQRWGLYLDQDDNLWILSSDIGHSCWIKNNSTNSYNNQPLYGPLCKDSLPKDLLDSFGNMIFAGQ